jgi:hypothetical protein
MAFEALFRGIRDQRFIWVTSSPGLPAPASGRCILLFVFRHYDQSLQWAFDLGALGGGKFVHIVQEDGFVRI